MDSKLLTRQKLAEDLKNLGLSQDQLLMVHVSARAIGNILGGPDEVHQAIMDVISPNGTLSMYVGCEPEFEIIGSNKISAADEKFLLENCPVFNFKTARARHDYGIVAEFFRSWPGVVCSENPGARMAALGPKAVWLTANHPLNYGYGPKSPLAKLYENDAKIMLLGSDLDQVTILHYAEHIAPISEKRIVRCKTPILKNRQRVWCEKEEYDTSIGIRNWSDQFFAAIMTEFLREHDISPNLVGDAESYLLDARLLVDYAIQIFVKAAKKHPI